MKSKREAVRAWAAAHPDATYDEVMQATGASRPTVSQSLRGWEPDEVTDARILRARDLIDESGKRYGRLTVLRFERGKGWLCRCECGRELHVKGRDLREGNVVRCGTCSDVSPGDRFGALVTVRRVGEGNGGGRLSMRWLCRCECGKECVRYESDLIASGETSCGCKAEAKRRQAKTSGRVDGTKLSSLTAAKSKANKTGVKGVYRRSRDGKYVANLKLRGVSLFLGSYDTVEEAAEARRRGEEEVFAPVLESHGRSLDP